MLSSRNSKRFSAKESEMKVSGTKRNNATPRDSHRCSRARRVVLLFALGVEISTIVSNWSTLWRLAEKPAPPIIPPEKKSKRQQSHVHTVFLDSATFQPKHGRRVQEVWMGARDPDHKFPEYRSILRNPGTLDGKNGEDQCVPEAKWQTEFYPVCNSFHELRFQLNRSPDRSRTGIVLQRTIDDNLLELLGVGTSIHAWKVSKGRDKVVLKTLQPACNSGCGFNDKFYRKQALDAVAAERLTSSPYILDVFGFCGMSVLNEFGMFLQGTDGLSTKDRLRYSRDLAAGMAALHGYGGSSHAMMTHGDFKPSNVIFSKDGSSLKISDFNKGRFLGWNKEENEPCGYLSAPSKAGAYILAPEEWFGDVRTEKTDVYHLGGMIFYLLTGSKPYYLNKAELQEREQRFKSTGEWALPVLPKHVMNAKAPEVVAMRKAIQVSLLLRQDKRASASEVLSILDGTLAKM